MSWSFSLCDLERHKKRRIRRGGGEEETRRQPDGGLIAALASEIGFMRHDGVTPRLPGLMLTCFSASVAGRKGRRERTHRPPAHWCAAPLQTVPRRARFIHKYRTIAISQRCHHLSVDYATSRPCLPSPPPPPFAPPKQHDNPPPLPPTPLPRADCQYG